MYGSEGDNMSRFILAILSAGVVALAMPALALAAPPADSGLTPQVLEPVATGSSPVLHHLPPRPPGHPPALRKVPRQPIPRQAVGLPTAPDPVLQSAPGTFAMPSTAANFEGIGNVDFVLPPDTTGAVGPNHYVQWVNLSLAVFDKATGTMLSGWPKHGNVVWQNLGGPCASANSGDPIVLYDHLDGRWLLSQFALPNGLAGPFYQCLAVSQSGDPTGAYHLYAFKISDTKLNDYPKFGVWPDGYYMAINQFTCMAQCRWGGQGVVVFEREKMLAGASARGIYFDLYGTDPNLGGMLPAALDGPPPPPGTPNYFAEFDDDAWNYSPDQIQIWNFSVTWGATPTASFTRIAQLATASFDSDMCAGSRNCIPQPGTNVGLDAIADRLMYRLQYRNFGTHQTLMANHTVDVGGDHAGIRWYELRNAGSGWGIHQQGTYAPDAYHRWMGSIAMDGAGNIALGFSMGGATKYPSIHYTGRLAGAIAGPGLMTETEAVIIDGAGSQTHTASRWGDYSTMSVDPVDDCTFWYTHEYYPSTTSASWHTRIASFKFPSCGTAPPPASADLSIVQGDSPDPVLTGALITYTLTVTNAGPADAQTVTVIDTLPAGVSGIQFPDSNSGWNCSLSSLTVTCNLAASSLGVGAAPPIAITVSAPTAAGSITNTTAVSSSTADPTSSNNSASSTTTVQAPPSTASITVVRPNGGEIWRINKRQNIQWTSTGVSGNVKIELSRNGGGANGTWETLFASTPNDGVQSWTVTGATTSARIRVCGVNAPAVCDESNANFTIR
jgi:uncharacterized repeat protein (TIGR01451 family)